MTDAIREKTGYDITGQSEEQLREACKRLNVETDATMGKGKLIDAIFGQYCEEGACPADLRHGLPDRKCRPLCKRHCSNPRTDLSVSELFVNGKGILVTPTPS